jgi:hypothetical protein
MFDIPSLPDARSVVEIGTLQTLHIPRQIEALQSRLHLIEADIMLGDADQVRDEIVFARHALAEIRDRVIPRYEERLEHLTSERDYGMRSDTRRVETKAPGAHAIYR